MLFKTGALKNFANFTGKHLCWNLFVIKLEACKRRLNGFFETMNLTVIRVRLPGQVLLQIIHNKFHINIKRDSSTGVFM